MIRARKASIVWIKKVATSETNFGTQNPGLNDNKYRFKVTETKRLELTLRYPKTQHLGPLGSFSAPNILPEESKRHTYSEGNVIFSAAHHAASSMNICGVQITSQP